MYTEVQKQIRLWNKCLTRGQMNPKSHSTEKKCRTVREGVRKGRMLFVGRKSCRWHVLRFVEGVEGCIVGSSTAAGYSRHGARRQRGPRRRRRARGPSAAGIRRRRRRAPSWPACLSGGVATLAHARWTASAASTSRKCPHTHAHAHARSLCTLELDTALAAHVNAERITRRARSIGQARAMERSGATRGVPRCIRSYYSIRRHNSIEPPPLRNHTSHQTVVLPRFFIDINTHKGEAP